VLLQSLGEDEYVVEVGDNEIIQEGHEQRVHDPRERGRRVGEPERHHQELEQSVTGLECRLVDVGSGHRDLVVACFEVEHREVGRLLGADDGQEVGDRRQWRGVLDC